MFTTIVLFLILNQTPGSIDLRLMDVMPNVDTCNAVIAGVKDYEKEHSDEPAIGGALRCAVITYKEPPPPLEHPCQEKHIIGKEINCNKEL